MDLEALALCLSTFMGTCRSMRSSEREGPSHHLWVSPTIRGSYHTVQFTTPVIWQRAVNTGSGSQRGHQVGEEC